MHWRWLVDASDDGLEVVDVESPRIEVAVPSHDVQRMVVEHDLVDAVVLLHENRKISHLVYGLDVCRPADVALRIRGAFDQLSEFVAIPLRPPHVPPALEDQQLRLLLGVQIEAIAVQDAAMDDEIIAFVKWQRPVSAL